MPFSTAFLKSGLSNSLLTDFGAPHRKKMGQTTFSLYILNMVCPHLSLLLIAALANYLLFSTGLQARKVALSGAIKKQQSQRKTRALIVATGPGVLA
jgi:hypothetical protein